MPGFAMLLLSCCVLFCRRAFAATTIACSVLGEDWRRLLVVLGSGERRKIWRRMVEVRGRDSRRSRLVLTFGRWLEMGVPGRR